MNVYNRVFDDQTQLKIRLESIAVDILFELIEKRNYELVWSLEERWISMLSNERTKFTDREIIEKGSKALINELGYAGFLRFIRYAEGISNEDYLKIEDEIFKGMTLEEIYDEAKIHWEGKK